MLAFVRAAVAAALVLLLSVPAIAADKPFQRDDLADAAIKLEAQIKTDAGQVGQARRGAAPRGRCGVPAQRHPRRHADARPDRRGRARRRANWLRLARAILQIRPSQRPRAQRCCSSAPRPPPTSPISAPAIAPRRPTAWLSSRAPSPTARCGGRRSTRCGFRSICARSPRCAQHTSGCARITASGCSTTRSIPMPPRRAPASSSPRSCRASAPISRRSSPSPARTSRRCRRGEAALRRGAQARRALQRHVARRPAVDREGDAVEVRRLQRLCARPQAVRALHRQGLRAAAHRPARHPGRQRQHHGGGGRNLSHRRPQPDRHRARPRLPAQSRPLRRQPPGRGARHQGLEGRARGRADAQCRRHHRVPGRAGGRRRLRPASTSWWRRPRRRPRTNPTRLRRNGSSSPISG